METRNCQNCKIDFIIDQADFDFYAKIKVPAPTFCPTCRFQRRLMFRNDFNLYKRTCDLCNKNIVTIIAPDKSYKVYCGSCWWGDGWDGTEYGRDYDFSRNFFEQFKDLMKETPFQNLIVSYSTLVNSDYINHAGMCKNCFMISNADYCENVYNSNMVVKVEDSAELLMMNNTNLAYDCVGGDGSRIFFSDNCPKSVDVWYSKDCTGCTNCFGCVNLHNKSYYIYNKKVERDEYNKFIQEMELDKYSTHKVLKNKIRAFWNSFPRKYMYGKMNKDVSGDYIYESKNTHNSFQGVFMEDCRYCQWVTLPTFKSNYDVTEWGLGTENSYESVTIGDGVNNIKFSSGVWANCQNVEYGIYNVNCQDCFGCVNLRGKRYCIFNKQYSKEEYEILVEQIKKHMDEMPYVDGKGRVFKYGEFLPYDVSLFDYNESSASEYWKLNKSEILEKGFSYREKVSPNYEATIKTEDIQDSIKDIPVDFDEEILSCAECNTVYKIHHGELELLRKLNLPVPRICFSCRREDRISRLNKSELYNRNCDKCAIEIQTSYSPEQPEKVFCESCYNREVL